MWVQERKSGNELWSLIVNYKTSLFENSLAITNVATLRFRLRHNVKRLITDLSAKLSSVIPQNVSHSESNL